MADRVARRRKHMCALFVAGLVGKLTSVSFDHSTATLHLGKLAPLFLMMPRLALLTRQIAITEGSERVRTGYECFAHACEAFCSSDESETFDKAADSTLKGLMKVERDCFLYLVNSTFVTITVRPAPSARCTTTQTPRDSM